MKLSKVISLLQEQLSVVGDINVLTEASDGRSTWASEPVPLIRYREIWGGHPAGKKHFIDL